MQKTLKVLALMALLAVPWAANAQSGCTIRVEGEDSWGDGWNGGSLTIAQGGTTLNTFSLSGSSDNLSITLTTSDAVTFTWNSGSYDSEVTIRIYDGGNTLVYSVTEPSSGLIYTMSSPCPSCLPPTNLTANNITTTGMTVSWSDAANNGNYSLSYWTNGGDTTTVSLTDTSYTLTGLNANSPYYFAVVSVCSATDSSVASNTLTFAAHFDVVIDPCDPATDLSYSDVTTTTAVLDWVSNGSEWQVEVKHLNVTDTLTVNTKPYTLTNLLPTMQYNVRVRTVCSGLYVEPYSDWSNTVTFTTQTPQSSINDVEDGMLAIYPNPASTVVSISVAMDGMVSLSLVDMNGRTVYSHTGSDGLFSIDVSTLAKGAYFVRVVGEQATSVRKLIVR